ncbi:Succinyl-CoA synthetase beta chain [Roseomonas mucosa]|jgi:succinyl-CoA synthetase beta subunit|uniref:Succinate--CoA ligase [ADP-forming] subunit beta n=2 Tax=Roseomonas TaxID=125216 RepID=A0A1S8D5F9_9PROT|nr:MULTISPECIES: ADP-forming succinate--CoA ligase subunit beta [Roseomonas]MBS5902714.1 ADP-forming succinate--CoA ligase subunit beta [Acetobacteraceae bacterium]MDT8262307.1 ADP-forming succinate--CoA ligase subunit beta [Roseomonas sp. DSM 102946]PZP43870.1 MAG: ADP-forming succinate--CoA ligase subunit beta [Azospirillum brasilense]APT58381.1 succinate--CoA ligase subunit beta [Roseomonas gilardii]ATR21432.1 ADP-forming succinate--CoA ligase subunit beta [Roseomonas sp. FDAARGOS_362]
MNIHEYQGKELLRRYGVAVLDGYVARTPEEAEAAAKKLPGPVVVVKSQIHAGGRGAGRFKDDPNGKGGVRVVKPEAAKEAAAAMIGHTLVTKQTGAEGKVVNQVYVEAGCDIKRELYLSILLDRETSRITVMASTEGGMEIEEVAEHQPEKILKVAVDPATGIQGWHARKLAFGLGLEGKQVGVFTKFVTAMYQAYTDLDMAIVEINPLVVTGAGEVVALDAKVSFDDNALFRHKDLEALRDETEMDPKELDAAKNDLNYVALDGEIGCMVNGAGLAMATMDIIKLYGSSPANFLDVGGTATADRVTEAFRIITSDSNVKGILVNIFGGIAKCDMIASGIVQAAKNLTLKVPLVVRLEGTNVDLGKKILAESGLAIIPADNLADAAQKVVDAVKKAA